MAYRVPRASDEGWGNRGNGQTTTPPHKVVSEEENLVPTETCNIYLRNIPVSLRAQLAIIKYKRGWKTWADMAREVVKKWGGGRLTEEENQGEELIPVETCFIVLRDIPVTLKAQLIRIKYNRGWKAWADMAWDVVKEWGSDLPDPKKRDE